MPKEASMIAYCGIHCEECPSYIGTITGDEALLVKMSEDYGNGKNDKIDFICLGCKVSDVKLIATDCAGCAIRLCAQAKNKDFCATCDEFETCENIKPYRDDSTSIHAKRNALIRAKYMRANG
jgi:hypothetical protein